MKKTIQSKLTAALFAAALSSGSGGAFSPQATAIGSDMDITTVPQTTYGPPAMTTTNTTTETTVITTPLATEGTVTTYDGTTTLEGTVTTCEDTTTLEGTVTTVHDTTTLEGTVTTIQDTTRLEGTVTTTTEPTTMPVTYGTEAPITTLPTEPNPEFTEPGDLNMDGSLDARDLSLLKQYWLVNGWTEGARGNSDVNGDGVMSKEDIKALVRLLTGKPEDDPEPETTKHRYFADNHYIHDHAGCSVRSAACPGVIRPYQAPI